MSDIPTELVEDPMIETPLVSQEGDYQYDQRFLSRVVEGAILANAEPLSIDKLLGLFDADKKPSRKQLTQTLIDIRDNQHDRGFVLKEVASGWRFEVCDDLAPWVNRLWDEKPQKYSRALLETLSLIAYRQPLTRGDIEDVRGVSVSSNIIRTLTERDWVKVIGYRDVPGRPALYATTRQFLDYFGLKSLEQLPSLGELQDIDSISAKLELGESPQASTTENLSVPVDNINAPVDENKETAADSASNTIDNTLVADTDTEEADIDTEEAIVNKDIVDTPDDPVIAGQHSNATTLSAADSTDPLKKTEV